MTTTLEKITTAQLKQTLDKDPVGVVLVLDCRPFLAYNNDRIVGAANVFCPGILKRRFAAKGFLNLENLVSLDVRKKLRNGHYTKLILYEHGEVDTHISEKSNTSEVYIILQALQRNNYSLKSACVLKGGFKKFRHDYPQWCISGRSTSLGESSSGSYNQHKKPCETEAGKRESEPNELLPHLYIGDESHSVNNATMKRIGITAIMNVSTNCQNQFSLEYVYKTIPVHDRNSEDISCWFGESIDFIEAVRRNHGKVLIHCKAGMSRSATICIAYLMYYKSLCLDDAFEFVRSKRSVISPNLNFMQQLIEFERVLVQKKGHIMCPVVSKCSIFPESDSNVDSNLQQMCSSNKFSFPVTNADLSLPLLTPEFKLHPLRL